MEAEVFDAFRSVVVADDTASAAAQALSKRDPDISILETDVTAIKADMPVLKWMVGFVGAMVASVMLRAFTH